MGQNWGDNQSKNNPIFGCLKIKWLNSLMAHESRFLKALGQDYALAGLVKTDFELYWLQRQKPVRLCGS